MQDFQRVVVAELRPRRVIGVLEVASKDVGELNNEPIQLGAVVGLANINSEAITLAVLLRWLCKYTGTTPVDLTGVVAPNADICQ